MKTFLSIFLLLLVGCSSVPKESAVNMSPYIPQVRESLEFSSNSAETRRFFTEFIEEAGDADDRMERYFDVLGENVSSAILAMKDPYADQISITLNRDMETFVKEVNRRVLSGGSIVEMQDVLGMTLEGEFVKVRLEAPGILAGYVYVMKDPIMGRTPAEQTFVDFMRPGQETRKLSISALIGLLED
jgi:hypothetical protein